jgi:hypothetical protein
MFGVLLAQRSRCWVSFTVKATAAFKTERRILHHLEYMLLCHGSQIDVSGGLKMKAISRWLIFGTVLMAVATSFVLAQAPAQPPAQTAQAQTFQGSLVKVDPEARTITAKATDNKEWQFSYTDQTEVVGPEKTIQGLAGKSGTSLKISYMVERGANRATRIEMLPAQ